MPEIIILCPHCFETVIIEELNCCIFRHAYYKNTMQQIPQHMTKQNIDVLREKDLILGCGGPFRVNKICNEYISEICDYI